MRLAGFAALVLAAAAASPLARAAEALTVAAAANLGVVMGDLNAAFAAQEAGAEVRTVTGSSGSLVAQIRNGAPFDLFLSADLEFAREVERSGQAAPSGVRPFAAGRLVLWTTRPGFAIADAAACVRSPAVRKIAVANMETAPYGRAAREAMVRLGVWDDARPKLVVADNIAQAAQFVDSGNADLGFVAMSAVLAPALKGRGAWSVIPQPLYEPIVQAAVVTRRGSANALSERYILFLLGPGGRRVLASFGYAEPPAPAR